MSDLLVPLIAAAAAMALVSLGGALYEFRVVDPFWPQKLDLIQPGRGGISRRRFWIPAHTAFELMLIASLVAAWSAVDVRFWLLVALASHAAMRMWSAVDFIPKALAFEKATSEGVVKDAARRWVRRSRLRLPLDLTTCAAMLTALVTVAASG